MLFTAIFNLPVILLALAVGTAALPVQKNNPLAAGPSHYFFLFLRLQPFVS